MHLCLQWIADALKIIGEDYGASISRYGGGTFILKLKNESPERLPMNWPRGTPGRAYTQHSQGSLGRGWVYDR